MADVDAFATATSLLSALRTGGVSATELTELYIRRIERHDGRLNAVVVRDFDRARQQARAAGAVLLGKTNVPPMLADWQSANPIFGRTNNPWDLTRTPGGSSGGSAAAIAAGLSELEVG